MNTTSPSLSTLVKNAHVFVGNSFSFKKAIDCGIVVGPRNPYPGKLGVIGEGAYADLLLINGDPLEDISILTKPEENLALIMTDGKVYKNTIK